MWSRAEGSTEGVVQGFNDQNEGVVQIEPEEQIKGVIHDWIEVKVWLEDQTVDGIQGWDIKLRVVRC